MRFRFAAIIVATGVVLVAVERFEYANVLSLSLSSPYLSCVSPPFASRLGQVAVALTTARLPVLTRSLTCRASLFAQQHSFIHNWSELARSSYNEPICIQFKMMFNQQLGYQVSWMISSDHRLIRAVNQSGFQVRFKRLFVRWFE